jgi:hypothetical protein
MAVRTVTPSWTAYKKKVTVGAIVLVPLAVAAALRVAENAVFLVGFVLALLMLIAVFVSLYFRNTVIEFGGGYLSRTNLFGVRRIWGADEVATVLVVEQLRAFAVADTHNTFILDAQGRTILRPTNEFWTAPDIRDLVESIGLTPEIIDKPITATALRERYPRAVPWWEAHSFATAWIAVGGFAVLFFGVSALIEFVPGVKDWVSMMLWRLGIQ